MKVLLEAQHRLRQPFDASAILLNDSVQGLMLTDFDSFLHIAILLFKHTFV